MTTKSFRNKIGVTMLDLRLFVKISAYIGAILLVKHSLTTVVFPLDDEDEEGRQIRGSLFVSSVVYIFFR
jgi:hypothetical protein